MLFGKYEYMEWNGEIGNVTVIPNVLYWLMLWFQDLADVGVIFIIRIRQGRLKHYL